MPLKGRDNVDKMFTDYKEDTEMRIRGVFFDGLKAVIKPTPVDEGRTRNNWFFTTEAPDTSSDSRGKDKSGSGSMRDLESMPKNILNTKIYLSNNMPSIIPLEFGGYPDPVDLGTWDKKKKRYEKRSEGGYSKQLRGLTPKGWVRGAMIRMTNAIRKL